LIKKVLSGDEIKQILYSVIEYEIGREKIQTDITSDIELSRKYIELIMSKCIAKLDFESNDDDNDDHFYATIHQKEKSQSRMIYLLM
jgi:hypothetical protein